MQEFSNQQPTVSFDDTSVAFSNHSNASLRKTYMIFALMNKNLFVKLGTFIIKTAISWHFPVKKLIKSTIFSQFCGGESIEECQKTIENLAKGKVSTILDYSVEGEDSEFDFEKTKFEILKTIQKAAKEPMIAFAVFKVSGLGSIDILEKKQSEIALNDTEQIDFNNIKKRVELLCQEADRLNVKLFFDAEESWIQETIDELCIEMMKRYNLQKVIVFNTYQMYKINSIDHIKSIIQNADNEGFKVGVKLVRGAYMERERSRAKSQNYPDPIQPNKESTDSDFDEALVLLLKNRNLVNVCLGTHNQASCQLCIEKMADLGINPSDDAIWFSQLMGMSDNISFNLANAGYNVAKYMPYGPVEAVMPYLFRRAEENTSIAGQTSREFQFVKNEVSRRAIKK